MTKKYLFIALLLLCFCNNSFAQTLSDSTIVRIAKFHCDCQDTINLKEDNAIIIRQMQDCFIKSVLVHLNNKELTKDYFDDKNKLNSLQNKVFNRLVDCNKTILIIQKLNNIPTPAETVPKELFITEEFFSKHGVKKGQVNNNFIVWNMISEENIQRVVDIRWVFKSNEEAIQYHRAKLKENSENGQEIQLDYKLNKAEEFHVFKENEQMENMIKEMKLPQRHHYFIFVVDNVVFKVFVASDKTLESKDVVFIAEEAISRLNKK